MATYVYGDALRSCKIAVINRTHEQTRQEAGTQSLRSAGSEEINR